MNINNVAYVQLGTFFCDRVHYVALTGPELYRSSWTRTHRDPPVHLSLLGLKACTITSWLIYPSFIYLLIITYYLPSTIYHLLSIIQQIMYHICTDHLSCIYCASDLSVCHLSSVFTRSIFIYLSSICGYNLYSYVSTYLPKYLSINLLLFFLFSSPFLSTSFPRALRFPSQ